MASRMPWIRRRRYDPYYDPYYYDRRRTQQSSSCLRDACLLETGCCVAESLDGNCLMLALPLLPGLFATTVAGLRSHGRSGAGLQAAIRFYQREISAHRPAVCRFTPSCSQYAAEAIDTHGAARGVLLAARRLVRCRPGGRRGPDPVPA
jgi:putative membrane protein insertion efficiency factor